uniref:Uncharacterized protein n=2 Tax=Timema TaxID=61471 RepID=A0A7R8ZEU0_TIMDO|nr:unnamed protein product [Timema douglasi]
MGLQRVPLDETEIISIIDKFLIGDADPEQKLLFAQRKVEFLEDFGSDILSVQKAHDEFQRFCKNAKDRKKKLMEAESKLVVETPSKKSKGSTSGNDSGAHAGSHAAVTPSQQPPQPQSGTQASTAAGQYPPPNYQGSSSSYTQSSTQGGYQGQYPQSTGTQQQPPAPYNQTPYNQQYSQSGDPNYANYQNWGYSQTGYGGYNQGWGNYNYY